MRLALAIMGFGLIGAQAEARCVVMLHGLARSSASFALMQEAFAHQGWRVVAPDYPSTKAPISALTAVITQAVAECGPAQVDFVTHSMGGIVLRAWAQEAQNAARIHRAVMLAPPNAGSEIVDYFGDQGWFGAFNGPAGLSLGTQAQDTPRALGPVTFALGVIAGDETLNPLTSQIVAGADDGKVSVESTKIEGMAAHLTLPVTHTFLMNDPRVIRETMLFLETGRFGAGQSWFGALRALLSP